MISTVLVTAPTTEPIDFDVAKAHLRLMAGDDPYDDALVVGLIAAARRNVEQFLNRVLITQIWDMYLDELPDDGVIEVPRSPLQSVTSFEYKATDYTGTRTTLAATEYVVDSHSVPGRIALAYGKYWPTLYSEIEAVKIRFVAGYGDDPEDVPEHIRQAILIKMTDLYEHRGGDEGFDAGIDRAVEALLWNDRVMPV